MTNVMLSLPSGLHAWAKEQAANNNFEDVGHYVQSILLKEREKQDGLAEFERLVQEGIDSGIDDRSMSEILDEARREFKDRQNGKL